MTGAFQEDAFQSDAFYVYTKPRAFPPFRLDDINGDYLQMINFEDIYPGRVSAEQTITFNNLLPSNVSVDVAAGSSYNGTDRDIDTKDSIYLSLDGNTWSKTISLTPNLLASQDFYIYWHPPSTGKIGSKIFPLTFDYTNHNDEIWDYVSTFTVTSTSATDQTDLKIYVTIPYSAGNMQTDFDDIRFYSMPDELESEIVEKIDSDYATFFINIPTLYATEERTIHVYTGNSTFLPSVYNVVTRWDWLDGTLDPWTDDPALYGDSVVNTTKWGYNALDIYNYSSNPLWNGCHVPSTACYGRWSTRFAFQLTTNSSWKWTFIDDGSHHYSIKIDQSGQSGSVIGLYYDDTTLLASASRAADTDSHMLVIERGSGGEFSVSIDGTELFICTDNTITSSITQSMAFKSWAGGIIHVYVDYITYQELDEDYPTVSALEAWDDLLFGITMMGKISYDLQDIPGLDNELRYGIRINGVLYE
jgi:hypothetical protein